MPTASSVPARVHTLRLSLSPGEMAGEGRELFLAVCPLPPLFLLQKPSMLHDVSEGKKSLPSVSLCGLSWPVPLRTCQELVGYEQAADAYTAVVGPVVLHTNTLRRALLGTHALVK